MANSQLQKSHDPENEWINSVSFHFKINKENDSVDLSLTLHRKLPLTSALN